MLALLFPGQGSQAVGMGHDVARASEAAQAVFDAADEALGFEISTLCFEGPEEELLRTAIQQPAILTTSVALHCALLERVPALEPAFVAGHSLGEYSALVASGVLSLTDAVRVVHARGRFMQEAVAEGSGAMAAVLGLGAEEVDRACEETREQGGGLVTSANYNAPQQTVIAGEAAAVERACNRARELGAKRTVPLKVSAPFHCALMAAAAEKLALELRDLAFSNPTPPVVTNVDAQPNTSGDRVRALLEAQVTAPVRFTEMIQTLSGLGVSRFLEIGPGRVLSGLVARISRRSERSSFSEWSDLDEVVDFVMGEVG